MKIMLLDDPDGDPVHEFETKDPSHVNVDCIILWEPTNTHYVYDDTDGQTFLAFRKAEVVTVTPKIGG